MRRVLAGVLVLVFGVGSGSTSAAANSVQDNALLEVAAAYWNATSSCPPATIAVREGVTSGEDGRSTPGGCWIARPTIPCLDCPNGDLRYIILRAGLSPVRRCVAVVHEYGHLLGFEHSNNPYSVMYPNGGLLVPFRCQAAADRYWVKRKVQCKRDRKSRCRIGAPALVR